MAAKDPALSLHNNQGHPTVAATTNAGQLSGAGVVAAHPGTPVAAIAPQGHNVSGTRGAATGKSAGRSRCKNGSGNAATIQGNHALPGCSRRAPRAQKLPPEPTPRRFPGNQTLPGVQSPGTVGTGAAGTKTGTGNTATLGLRLFMIAARGSAMSRWGRRTRLSHTIPVNTIPRGAIRLSTTWPC
jgi:hypothetical protein